MLVETPDFPPKHPLAEAAHSILQAYLIAEAHLKKRGSYTMQDLELADQLRTSVWTYYFRFAELHHHVRLSFSGFTDPRPAIISDI